MRSYIGFGVLSFFTLVLYGVSLFNLYAINVGYMLLFFVFILFTFVTIIHEFRQTRHQHSNKYPLVSKAALFVFVTTTLGALLAFGFNAYLGLGGVLASGIVGLIGAYFFKPYAVGIFCGSFLGMTSPELFYGLTYIVAALLVGLLFVLAQDVWNGYGGKLGTIALSGAMIVSIVSGTDFLETEPFTNLEAFLIVVFSIIGALLTYILNVRYALGPVKASALVGVVFGLLLPLLMRDLGQGMAVVVFGASFVGMSNQKTMPEESMIILAGLLFGLIYLASAPYFGGAGGKLGTIAFSSVLSVYGLRRVLRLFIDRPINRS